MTDYRAADTEEIIELPALHGSAVYVENLILMAIKENASDVHAKTDRQSKLRIKTVLNEITDTRCRPKEDDLYAFCYKHMPADKERLDAFRRKQLFSIDSTVIVHNRRLRMHLFRSMSGPCATLRLLSEKIPDLDKLNLPPSLHNFIQQESGLVLITGATGSGKTTTIASIVDAINRTRPVFILTIEDPVEYLYHEAMATIEQREVGHDVKSFGQATVDAMREDPNVIVVGEMRDLDTIQNAITLAETGHLVFGTLHAKSVIDAVDRMIDVFPPEQQQQIRVQLSSVINGIVHQQMVRSNGQIAVLCEVLMFDAVLRNQIKNAGTNPASIRDGMRSRTKEGCVHIADNAFWHIQQGRMTFEDVKQRLSSSDLMLLQAQLNATSTSSGHSSSSASSGTTSNPAFRSASGNGYTRK